MMTKALVAYVSIAHGNTKRIADAIGDVLDARVDEPEQFELADLSDCDVIGFGSGIYWLTFHPRMRRFVRELPPSHGRKAFVFTTSGFPAITRPMTRLLESRGFEIVGTFQCRGLDTWGPFRLFGGLNRSHPDSDDLAAARSFAERLRSQLT